MTLLARPRALCACLLLLTATAAQAILPPESRVAPGREDLLRPWLRLQQAPAGPRLDAELAAADPSFQAFAEEAGGTWRARYDLRTGTPALVWGSGVPWLPGRGNDLSWSALGFSSRTADEAVFDLLESRARELLARHPGLFGGPASRSCVTTAAPCRSTEPSARSCSASGWAASGSRTPT